MSFNIIPDLLDKMVPIDSIIPLKVNPHKGNIEAAAVLLADFGQHTPILVHSETKQILSGNTRWRAAKSLDWTHIAVIWIDEDESRAVARALSDNRLAELGTDDSGVLAEVLATVIDDYPEVFAVLGWDEWEVSALESSAYETSADSGYTPPPTVRRDPVTPNLEVQEDGSNRLSAPSELNQQDLVQRGAGETDPKRATVIQYTLVFDDAEQQRRWYQFITWLRSDPELTQYVGTANKLLNFLEARVDF